MKQDMKNKRIAIQGVSGAFHEIAARHYFKNESVQVIPSNSFEKLIELTQNPDLSDGGIMAIENSIAGSILQNYSLIRQSNLAITGELFLRIKQNLLAIKNQKVEDLTEVHSHPMAIAQCRPFFKKYPNIKLIETEDTALSARYISEKNLKHIGAIASNNAAEKYDLNVLAEGIETNKQNYTRFLILDNITSSIPANYNKASICFSLKHQIGSLHKVLAGLADQGANLTKIQSVPIVGQSWHYLFFVDFVLKNPDDFNKTIKAIEFETEALQILGRYKTGKHYDN